MKMFAAFILAVLITSLTGCGKEPSADPPSVEPPVCEKPAMVVPTAETVAYIDGAGTRQLLAEGCSIDDIVEILGHAVYYGDELPPCYDGDPAAAGRLLFTGPAGDEEIRLVDCYLSLHNRVFTLEPNRLSAMLSCFALKEIDGLVRINDLDPTIVIDLRYATADNFTGKVIYPTAVGVINRETGERLRQANEIFRRDGYRIKVWDAYRPYSCQQLLWNAFPDPRYVINPAHDNMINLRPRHNNGMSVDITLVDANGNELEMPTGFDDFSERAHPDYPGMTPEARRNMEYLTAVMESVGFEGISTEWWHFNDMVGTPGPHLDIPLEAFLE